MVTCIRIINLYIYIYYIEVGQVRLSAFQFFGCGIGGARLLGSVCASCNGSLGVS